MTLRESLCKCFPAPPKPGQQNLHLHPGRHFAKDAKDDVENLYSILGLQKGKTLRLQTVRVSSDFKQLNRVDQFLLLSFLLCFKLLPFGNRCSTCKLLLLLVAQLQGASPEEIKAAYKRLAKDGIFRVHVMGRLQMGILHICWSSLLIS